MTGTPAEPYAVAAIVLSDRAARGERADGCLPVIHAGLGPRFRVTDERIIADDPAALQAALIELCDRRIGLILTSGGTGLAARDRTPQATAAVLDYEVPGIGEAMRAASMAIVPTSPKAVRETLEVILPALPHALDLLAGGVKDG